MINNPPNKTTFPPPKKIVQNLIQEIVKKAVQKIVQRSKRPMVQSIQFHGGLYFIIIGVDNFHGLTRTISSHGVIP